MSSVWRSASWRRTEAALPWQQEFNGTDLLRTAGRFLGTPLTLGGGSLAQPPGAGENEDVVVTSTSHLPDSRDELTVPAASGLGAIQVQE